MKRITTLLVLCLMAVSFPAFAGISKGTIAGFYTFESYDQTITYSAGSVDAEGTARSAGIIFKGSYYRPGNNLGFSYNARIGKLLSSTVNGTEQDVSDAKLGWDAGTAFTYQIPVTYDSFAEFGVGIQVATASETVGTATSEVVLLYGAAFAELNYTLDPSMFVNVGLNLYVPVWGITQVTSGSTTYVGQITSTGLTIAPYVGISFAY